jgi:hypothetical protein
LADVFPFAHSVLEDAYSFFSKNLARGENWSTFWLHLSSSINFLYRHFSLRAVDSIRLVPIIPSRRWENMVLSRA